MIMTNVDLPINCLIKRKVFTVLSTIIIIAIGKFITDTLFDNCKLTKPSCTKKIPVSKS